MDVAFLFANHGSRAPGDRITFVRSLAMMTINSRWICVALLLLSGLWACASKEEIRVSALHHFERGNEAFKIEDYPGAIHHYRAALDLDKRSPDIWYNLGLALYEAGNYEDAIEAFESSLALDPKRPETHYNLALAYHRNLNRDSAHLHYNAYQDMTRAQDATRVGGGAGAAGAGVVGATPAANAPGAGATGTSKAAAGRPGTGQPAGAKTINPAQGAGAESGRPERQGQDRGTAPGGAGGNVQRQQANQPQQPARAGGQPGAQRQSTAGQSPARQTPQGAPRDGRTNPSEGNEEWWKADLPQR